MVHDDLNVVSSDVVTVMAAVSDIKISVDTVKVPANELVDVICTLVDKSSETVMTGVVPSKLLNAIVDEVTGFAVVNANVAALERVVVVVVSVVDDMPRFVVVNAMVATID